MHIIDIHPTPEHLASPPQRLALWIGFLGGPVLWFVQLIVSYSLVWEACNAGRRWPLYAATVLFLAAAAASGIIAWRQWAVPGRSADEAALDRTRFMGLVGLLTSALFFILILMQGIPVLIFNPCET